MPIVVKCKEELTEFYEENNNMREAVRVFDENICAKADRW